MAGVLASMPGYSAHHPTAEHPHRDGERIEKTIAPGKIHEECALVRANQQLHYEFSASAGIEFNFHYHDAEQGKIVYLFGPAPVNSTPGINRHTVLESRVLCLMWRNTHADAINLEYSFGVSQQD